MSGSAIVGHLLRSNGDIAAKVPPARIKGGRLPDGTPLPALLVKIVSVVDRQPLKSGAMRRTTVRVRVTVRAATYEEQGDLIDLVRRCCADWLGDIGPLRRISVLLAGTGPDLTGPADSFEQAQDFRVGFEEPA